MKHGSMKKKILILSLLALVALGGIIILAFQKVNDPRIIVMKAIEVLPFKKQIWGQALDNAFLPVDCPTSTRVLSDAHYRGPLIDTHIHVPEIEIMPFGPGAGPNDRPTLGSNASMANYVCMMDYENTKKVFAFFPVYAPLKKQMTEVVERSMSTYKDRFVPFIMPPDRDDMPDGFPTVDAKTLESMLDISPGLFRGYGEIGLYARGDNGGPTGSPELPPDSERLQKIYPLIRKNNLIVYFHLGRGQQESFEKVLDQNPDINFIWHGDQLIPYTERGQDLSHIEEILNKHKNAYYGVDELYGDTWILKPEIPKDQFLAHFKDAEKLLKQDLETWKGFIERHPDQVLWGTDRGWSAPWSLDPDVALTLNTYTRAFIGRLDPKVQEKYAYKNAERLLSAASKSK